MKRFSLKNFLDIFKVDNPSLAFSTPEQDHLTIDDPSQHTLTPPVFFQQRNGILQPLARFFDTETGSFDPSRVFSTPERDSFKIDNPLRVFDNKTGSFDPSHVFSTPTPEWERVQSANFTVASTLTSDSLLTVYIYTLVFYYHTQCPTIAALSHRRPLKSCLITKYLSSNLRRLSTAASLARSASSGVLYSTIGVELYFYH